MSILFARLLRQAQAKFAEGDNAEAETLCCQVLTGASTLADTKLVADAATLLTRVPVIDGKERTDAVLLLHNKTCAMQHANDDEAALSMCESLLLLTPSYPGVHAGVHNMAIFLASRLGPERRQPYIERLVALLDAVPMPDIDPARGIEVDVEEGPELAADVLASRGAVLIRRLIDIEHLSPFRDTCLQLFHNKRLQALNVDEVGDPTPMLAGATPFINLMLQRFFPARPTLRARQTYVRRVKPERPETAVPFHQDVQAFGRMLVNLWTPLSACGRDAPGLELVTARLRDLAVTESASDQYDALQISEQLVHERFGKEGLCRPEMEPGDVLAFLGTTIHRTYIVPEMTEDRFSVELRFGIE
jgi:hypothetical protein